MKLLFDQNLSVRLVERLANLFPNSIHVRDIGLDTATDIRLWNYARENGYLIILKDTDFSDRVSTYGYPPKVIWLRIGNCSTDTIERIPRKHYSDIKEFAKNQSQGLLVLL